MKKISRAELLICDEWGYVPHLGNPVTDDEGHAHDHTEQDIYEQISNFGEFTLAKNRQLLS